LRWLTGRCDEALDRLATPDHGEYDGVQRDPDERQDEQEPGAEFGRDGERLLERGGLPSKDRHQSGGTARPPRHGRLRP
jgi:hypothetical protein